MSSSTMPGSMDPRISATISPPGAPPGIATLQVNLIAAGHFCRDAIRHFKTRRHHNQSRQPRGSRGDDADYMHYAASKGGIVSMTRTIARHFGQDNITAFAVAPALSAPISTPPSSAITAWPRLRKASRWARSPNRQDIANTIAFLASGLARHATGTTIDINGASYVR